MKGRHAMVASLAVLAVGLVVLGVVGGMLIGRLGRQRVVPAPPALIAAEPQAPPDPDRALLAQALGESQHLAALAEDDLPTELSAWAAAAEVVMYAQLERNAEAHRRHKTVFTGRVLEINDVEGGSIIRLATSGREDDVVWIETLGRPPERIVANTRVRAYGYLFGAHTYTSQAGWRITLPMLVAVAVVDDRLPLDPRPPPAFDWNDECPTSAIGSIPAARDLSYGAGVRDPAAFATREARRLISAGREMEPYRRGEAGVRVVERGIDLTGGREVGCMQRRYQSQAHRLAGYVGRMTHEASSERQRQRMWYLLANVTTPVHRCVSGMREGRALAACDDAERLLR